MIRLTDISVYSEAPALDPVVTNKGEQLLDELMLSQYRGSPLFKQYFMCYIPEFDTLFEQAELLYYGRFLDYAVGAQLDIIGRVLGQSRAIALDNIYFGFQGSAGAIAGMSDENSPTNGGIFKDGNQVGEGVLPLTDRVYSKLLKARAIVSNQPSISIALAYKTIATLLGRVPSTFVIEDGLTYRSIQLTLSSNELTNTEVSLIDYFSSKYLVPTGIKFTIIQVA